MTTHKVNENSVRKKSLIRMLRKRLPSKKLLEMRIRIWNVRTLNEIDKLENLKEELEKKVKIEL